MDYKEDYKDNYKGYDIRVRPTKPTEINMLEDDRLCTAIAEIGCMPIYTTRAKTYKRAVELMREKIDFEY